jgi:hypothetical protein
VATLPRQLEAEITVRIITTNNILCSTNNIKITSSIIILVTNIITYLVSMVLSLRSIVWAPSRTVDRNITQQLRRILTHPF